MPKGDLITERTWVGFHAAEATCFHDHRHTPAHAATVTDLADQDADIDHLMSRH